MDISQLKAQVKLGKPLLSVETMGNALHIGVMIPVKVAIK